MGGHAPRVRQGIRGKEGILWGMPGESRGTLRAAPCACVELISSPPVPPLLPLPHCCPLFLFHVPECWQRQRRARTPSGLGPAASSRSPTLSSSLSLSLSFSLYLYFSLSFHLSSSLSRARFLFLPLLYLSVPPPFAVPYLFLFTLLRLMYSRCRHLLIKLTLFLSFYYLSPPSYIHPPPYLSSSRSISLSGSSLVLLASSPLSYLARFSFSSCSPLRRAFHVLRLIFPIQRPLIKLYFANPCGFSEHFGKSRFHGAVAIACFVGSMMRSSRVTCY